MGIGGSSDAVILNAKSWRKVRNFDVLIGQVVINPIDRVHRVRHLREGSESDNGRVLRQKSSHGPSLFPCKVFQFQHGFFPIFSLKWLFRLIRVPGGVVNSIVVPVEVILLAIH